MRLICLALVWRIVRDESVENGGGGGGKSSDWKVKIMDGRSA